MRTGRVSQPFKERVSRPATPPPQAITWWWNPGRFGVYTGPHWFNKRLEEIDENLAVTWSRWHQRWIVWMKKPQIANKLCNGWLLLFVVEDDNKQFQPLDERIFWRLYSASSKHWGSAKKYFDAIEAQMAKDKAAAEKTHQDELMTDAAEKWQHMQISVGYGKSSGSKYSKFLS